MDREITSERVYDPERDGIVYIMNGEPRHFPEVIIIVIVIKIGISTLPFFWQSVEIPLILELPAFLFIFP